MNARAGVGTGVSSCQRRVKNCRQLLERDRQTYDVNHSGGFGVNGEAISAPAFVR